MRHLGSGIRDGAGVGPNGVRPRGFIPLLVQDGVRGWSALVTRHSSLVTALRVIGRKLHHGVRPRIRRSTSSQGMPMGPSRSSSSSRRSNSSRWAWVMGIRRSRQALPKFIQESQPFFEAETCNIDRGHTPSIPHLPSQRRGRRVGEPGDPVIG